jgi:tetratricopeptide (TPR) repeat protein
LLPYFLISAVYITLRLDFLSFVTLRPPALTRVPFFLRLTVLPKVFLTYVKLLVLPVNLHMSRELVRPTTFFGIYLAWFSLGTLIVACATFLQYRKERKTAPFLLSWFLVFILPQSGIFAINAFVSEHFIYLSSISFFIAVAYLLHKYLRKQLFVFSFVSFGLYYGLLTVSRNYEWQDPTLFYQRIIQFSPSSFQAYNNLGLQYEHRNLYDLAIQEYKKALAIKPDLLEAHSNLASIYYKTGRPQDALKEYAIVEKTAPGSKAGEIQNNIAVVYDAQGLFDEALNRYERALALDPHLDFTHFNMARIDLVMGKTKEAASRILKSLPELAADNRRSKKYLFLIEAYLSSSKKMDCSATFYNNLGIRFAQEGLFDAAIAAFGRALEVDPQNPDKHFNLGLAYWKKGLNSQAAQEFKSALKINPFHTKAKGMLSVIKKSCFFCGLLY